MPNGFNFFDDRSLLTIFTAPAYSDVRTVICFPYGTKRITIFCVLSHDDFTETD